MGLSHPLLSQQIKQTIRRFLGEAAKRGPLSPDQTQDRCSCVQFKLLDGVIARYGPNIAICPGQWTYTAETMTDLLRCDRIVGEYFSRGRAEIFGLFTRASGIVGIVDPMVGRADQDTPHEWIQIQLFSVIDDYINSAL